MLSHVYSTERFIQVTFMPDGTFNQTGAENTNAVGLLGTWAQSVGGISSSAHEPFRCGPQRHVMLSAGRGQGYLRARKTLRRGNYEILDDP